MKSQPKTLKDLSVLEIVKLISISKYAGDNYKSILDKKGWLLLASEIKKDAGNMTIEKLTERIMLGIKGELDDKSQPINFRTIYSWVVTKYYETIYKY